jgi:predicted dithiol-disulfide oxidoreductase (DUF899 family)
MRQLGAYTGISNSPMEGEPHGPSVFFKTDDDLFHTYSTYARGTESLADS